MADETPAPPAGIKPGWKTSEFWLSALASVVGAVLASGVADTSPVMKVAGVVAMLLSAMGYTVVRGGVKKSLALLPLLLGLSMMGGCCSSQAVPLRAEVESENALMAELSAYITADPKKSDDLKRAEAAKIKAHLDLFNSLTK